MRRIALISDHASPLATLGGVDGGGQNVYVGQLARHLVARGDRVDIFTRRDAGNLPDIVPWGEGGRVIHVPAGPAGRVRKEELLPYMGEFIEFVLRHCRRRPYDLVHANFFLSALVAAEVKRVVETPFVVTFHALGRVRRLHQGGADAFPEERLAIEDRAVREADRIIAECPQDEDDLHILYGADPARIRTVPCGFDPDEFRPLSKPLARAMLGLDGHGPILLQLGRMVPRKGVDNVIRGLALLRNGSGIPARLLIVGGESSTPDPRLTPEIGRLMAIAEREGVADAVTFVGSRGRDALNAYYSAADVFITTPWYEPFGITPLEAMACGTPVVGSAVGGIRSTVQDGRTGYLVPPEDPPALAARLADLLGDPERLRAFGRRAVHVARSRYTWARVAESVSAVYEELIPSHYSGCARAWANRSTSSARPAFRPETPGIRPSS
ncbi:glycosyltransferase [Tautonia plasticadhaerens]|uniref:D-inositol 3-phosphate glycosyltransferase n=1 Tax=Tautonia plasticadhaerens TaxID=2527974 RepID=A0A518H604_9BACT|nr:glycosyltransferase [Tautonia plasticadhaerens]QDV36267.1 D-inositol 3-phosphate glycosyltransferase [Tautonia plasticadhaerens]